MTLRHSGCGRLECSERCTGFLDHYVQRTYLVGQCGFESPVTGGVSAPIDAEFIESIQKDQWDGSIEQIIKVMETCVGRELEGRRAASLPLLLPKTEGGWLTS